MSNPVSNEIKGGTALETLSRHLPNLVFAAMGLFLLSMAFAIPNPGFDPLGPGFLPIIVLSAMVFFSLLAIVVEQIDPARQTVAPAKTTGAGDISNGQVFAWLRPTSTALLLAALIWALNEQIAPFEILGAIFMMACGTLLSGLGRKAIIRNFILSCTLPVIVGYAFKTFLYVNLP